MNTAEVQRRILESYGIRVEPEMSQYVVRRLTHSRQPVAVLGADARTGVPVRAEIDPDILGICGEIS